MHNRTGGLCCVGERYCLSQGKLIGEEACEVFWCQRHSGRGEGLPGRGNNTGEGRTARPWTSIFYVAVYVGQRMEPRVAGDPKR